MEGEIKSSRVLIILGRPFMKTIKKIDVDGGTMSMKFGDIIAKFNIFDAMKHPLEENYVFYIKLLCELVDDTYYKLLSIFPSISDFDDIYSCDACTNTRLCSIFAEIEVSLQVDVFLADEVVGETVFSIEALDIPASPAKSSIE